MTLGGFIVNEGRKKREMFIGQYKRPTGRSTEGGRVPFPIDSASLRPRVIYPSTRGRRQERSMGPILNDLSADLHQIMGRWTDQYLHV